MTLLYNNKKINHTFAVLKKDRWMDGWMNDGHLPNSKGMGCGWGGGWSESCGDLAQILIPELWVHLDILT
jgi:hypothetical protein